jgi:mono/diheme cytochrome c family protein
MTSRMIRIAAAVIVAAVIVWAAIGIYHSRLSAQQTDSLPRSVWDGVYTKAQAARGAKVYAQACVRCHAPDLTGNGALATALVGDQFLSDWNGQTASDLFARAHDTMPTDSPGSLSEASDADLLAYIFSANSFPAGAKELGHDPQRLRLIEIQPSKSANN